jgi:CrcB protein
MSESRPSLQSQRRVSCSRQGSQPAPDYDVPYSNINYDELATPSLVRDPNEDPLHRNMTLEEARSQEEKYVKDQKKDLPNNGEGPSNGLAIERVKVSKFATRVYTISYLVLFAILGTLARLGLQSLTFYPGAPLVFSELWANFGGSFFVGYLIEDRVLFGKERGSSQDSTERGLEEENGSRDTDAAKQAHFAAKKTIPLFIGLTTGFCGCFTSFSSFIRDAFLALSNDLLIPVSYSSDPSRAISTVPAVSRNGGYSFMALVAVIVITVPICISGFYMGVHLAVALEPYIPNLPYASMRNILDRVVVVLAWGCWLGAILLSIWPPDRNSDSTEVWRGRAVFAIVFAPLGCLGRFFASLYLNGKIASFPLGTFVVNIAGTVILGIVWDLQHLTVGGVIGCQVLQGVGDGFCGSLTTVSTWVSELSTLRRSHAYKYGFASVTVAICFLIVIMGSLRWTIGYADLLCVK